MVKYTVWLVVPVCTLSRGAILIGGLIIYESETSTFIHLCRDRTQVPYVLIPRDYIGLQQPSSCMAEGFLQQSIHQGCAAGGLTINESGTSLLLNMQGFYTDAN